MTTTDYDIVTEAADQAARDHDPINTLSALIEYASGSELPCWFQGKSAGKHPTSCVDRLGFHYHAMLPKRAADAACPACLAYWHLQMARNAFINDRRGR